MISTSVISNAFCTAGTYTINPATMNDVYHSKSGTPTHIFTVNEWAVAEHCEDVSFTYDAV